MFCPLKNSKAHNTVMHLKTKVVLLLDVSSFSNNVFEHFYGLPTRHGVLPGCMFTLVVISIASGLIFSFPLLQCHHVSWWSRSTCYTHTCAHTDTHTKGLINTSKIYIWFILWTFTGILTITQITGISSVTAAFSLISPCFVNTTWGLPMVTGLHLTGRPEVTSPHPGDN